ncbi:SH3 domain-containing protein [Streptomyces sp. NPDC014734]|uniref:SH3 domain-containing protein n=1 Tax=Streptomyces sp. NPDC014734 TaxID=3364886 RepID=UPI003702D5B2
MRVRHVAAASGAAAAVVLGAAPLASAAPLVPAKPYATVLSTTGLNERQYPSTDSSVVGTLRYRDQVGLRCKVRAQDSAGNDVWYLLRDREAWISARYADQTGTVPYCKDARQGPPALSAQAQHAMG